MENLHLRSIDSQACQQPNCSTDNILLLFDCKVRSSPLEVFPGKDVLKICGKFTGEHPHRSVVSIELLCNFI